MVREFFFGTFCLILVVLVLVNSSQFSEVMKSLTGSYTEGVGAFIGKK